MNKLKLFTTALCLACLTVPTWLGAHGSTSVGNGGSLLRALIKASRNDAAKILETMKLEKQKALDSKEGFGFFSFVCKKEESFTEEQLGYCRYFLLSVVDQMLELVTKQPLDFKIVEKKLFDVDEQGNPVPVDAMALDHDKDNPILFNYEAVHELTLERHGPRNILFIWFHELGHKVKIENQYVNDYDPIGPFQYGHQLLDGVAQSLFEYAVDKEIIHEEYRVMDRFECLYYLNNKLIFEFTGASRRYFKPTNQLNRYAAGFSSKNPFWDLTFIDPETKEKVYLELEIFEDMACDPSRDSQRDTEFQLRRLSDDRILQRPASLKSSNPICDKKPVTIIYDPMTFTCRHVEEFALTGIPSKKDYLIKKPAGSSQDEKTQ